MEFNCIQAPTSTNGLQGIPSNQEKLSSKQLQEQIINLFDAQTRYFTDSKEDLQNTKKKKILIVQMYLGLRKRTNLTFQRCWEHFKLNFTSNMFELDSLSKIIENCKFVNNYQFDSYISKENVLLKHVTYKKYFNKEMEFPDKKDYQPLYRIPDELKATKLIEFLEKYDKYIDVKLPDTIENFYDFKSEDENISANNTNLIFDQTKLNEIPKNDREFLLNYIKPYMFTPSDSEYYFIYGKETASQRIFLIQRQACVTKLYDKLSKQIGMFLCVRQLNVEHKEILISFKFVNRMKKEFMKNVSAEKRKIAGLNHLLQSYISTLEEESRSSFFGQVRALLTIPSNPLLQEFNLFIVEDISEQTESKVRRKETKKSDVSNQQLNEALNKKEAPSGSLKRIFYIPEQFYSSALTLIGNKKSQITWDDACKCLEKLNFKIERMGESIYKFTQDNKCTFIDAQFIGEKIDQIWKKVSKPSKYIHEDKKDNRYLSNTVMAKLKRMCEQVEINAASLKSIK